MRKFAQHIITLVLGIFATIVLIVAVLEAKDIIHIVDVGAVAFSLTFIVVLTMLVMHLAHLKDRKRMVHACDVSEELKQAFIEMVGHELRTPITNIRGYMELMRENGEGLSDEQLDYAFKVEKSASHLHDLVADMITVTEFEQGRMSFEYSDFDIADVVDDVVNAFRLRAQEKGIVIKIDGLKELIIHSDREKVRKILVNLVSNAIKYTKKGEVLITFKEEKDEVIISVKDSGIGMSEKDRERLFHKFYRIKSAETNEIAGTGLGLWLARAIIGKLKGSINVESVIGKGSTFTIRIPAIRK